MSNWADRWQKTGQEFSGGQGQSFAVTSKDEHHLSAFVKTLKRRRDSEARSRFRREVVAYETLSGAGLPRIYEHNADEWNRGVAGLYMVLELIPGMNLDEYVKATGPLDLASTRALGQSLISSISACHEQGVIHRDIKPKNIVLRDGNPTSPVLIDFGLSFNKSATEEDITQIGEEIGNRFLRLPEQASGIRSSLSDVSQTAGVIFYCFTGVEPRVLLDENSAMPHQRPRAAETFRSMNEGPLRNRLLGFFDRAFASRTEFRFQTIEELGGAFDAVFAAEDTTDDFHRLMAQVDGIAHSAETAQVGVYRARLDTLLRKIVSVVQSFANARNLQASQTAHEVWPDGTPPSGSTRLAVFLDREAQRSSPNWVEYKVQLAGEDVVFLADGAIQWRGVNLNDESFEQAVMTVAARNFLSTQTNEFNE